MQRIFDNKKVQHSMVFMRCCTLSIIERSSKERNLMGKILFYLSILNLLYFFTTFFIHDSTNPFIVPLFGPPIISFFLLILIVIYLLYKLVFEVGRDDELVVSVQMKYAIGINGVLFLLGNVFFFFL